MFWIFTTKGNWKRSDELKIGDIFRYDTNLVPNCGRFIQDAYHCVAITDKGKILAVPINIVQVEKNFYI